MQIDLVYDALENNTRVRLKDLFRTLARFISQLNVNRFIINVKHFANAMRVNVIHTEIKIKYSFTRSKIRFPVNYPRTEVDRSD